MARGDAYVVENTIANGASLTVQPGSGTEVLVFNILHQEGMAVEVYWTISTGPTSEKWLTTTDALTKQSIVLTNSNYMTVKNVSGSTQRIRVDGVYTK